MPEKTSFHRCTLASASSLRQLLILPLFSGFFWKFALLQFHSPSFTLSCWFHFCVIFICSFAFYFMREPLCFVSPTSMNRELFRTSTLCIPMSIEVIFRIHRVWRSVSLLHCNQVFSSWLHCDLMRELSVFSKAQVSRPRTRTPMEKATKALTANRVLHEQQRSFRCLAANRKHKGRLFYHGICSRPPFS